MTMRGSAAARLMVRESALRAAAVKRAMRELGKSDTALDGLGADADPMISPERRLWKAVVCKAFDDLTATTANLDPVEARYVELCREDAKQFLLVRTDNWTRKVFDMAGVKMVDLRQLLRQRETAAHAA